MYSPKAVLGNCSGPSRVGVEVQIVRDAFGKNLTPKRTRGKHLSSYFSKVSNETNSILGGRQVSTTVQLESAILYRYPPFFKSSLYTTSLLGKTSISTCFFKLKDSQKVFLILQKDR